jgi:hypothetical protein
MGKLRPAAVACLLLATLWTGWGWCEVEEEAPRDREGELAKTLSHYGRWVPLYATPGLVLFGEERAERAGRQAADAIIVTSVTTSLLKHIVQSSRPESPDMYHGFPSGHTSLNFAFARSLAAEYPQLSVPLYAFATGVGWSRVRGKSHTVIQVVAGAAIGWYIADRSVHSNGGLLEGRIVERPSRAGFTAAPVAPPGGPKVELWKTSW